jgi:uncharacterized membrane protein
MLGMYGFEPGAVLLGGMTMLLFWTGLGVLVVWAVRQFPSGVRPAAEEPIAIARRRLATGEIGQDQYEQTLRTLQGSDTRGQR